MGLNVGCMYDVHLQLNWFLHDYNLCGFKFSFCRGTKFWLSFSFFLSVQSSWQFWLNIHLRFRENRSMCSWNWSSAKYLFKYIYVYRIQLNHIAPLNVMRCVCYYLSARQTACMFFGRVLPEHKFIFAIACRSSFSSHFAQTAWIFHSKCLISPYIYTGNEPEKCFDSML